MAKPDMFLALLLESGLHVLAVETPNASPFVLQIYAAAAEEYRKAAAARLPSCAPRQLHDLHAVAVSPYDGATLVEGRVRIECGCGSCL
jgi:hypothetical protein